MTEEGLSLTDGRMTLTGDLSSMKKRIRPDRLAGESLIKAARIKNSSGKRPVAADATAGLGEDSFLLAAAGFEVLMFERDPVIAALLDDALRRAAEDPDIADIAERMSLTPGDSAEGMAKLSESPDVILLDPMFPGRKKSGLIKKKFQLLGRLEPPAADEDQTRLVRAALAAGPQKIVIKRPEKGGFLGGIKPSYSLSGSTVRYDVIVCPARGGNESPAQKNDTEKGSGGPEDQGSAGCRE